MFYIRRNPINNHYGNPISNKVEDMVLLPDNLIKDYIETMGFANLVIEDDVVVSLTINQEAYDEYQESLPEPVEEPTPLSQDEIEDILLDQEYRILLLEYGLN